jgi:hypothetical protein
MIDRERAGARTHARWTLHKDGRAISCVVSDLEPRGCELRISRSDRAPRSVHLYPARAKAIGDARRVVDSYTARGWTLISDEQ